MSSHGTLAIKSPALRLAIGIGRLPMVTTGDSRGKYPLAIASQTPWLAAHPDAIT